MTGTRRRRNDGGVLLWGLCAGGLPAAHLGLSWFGFFAVFCCQGFAFSDDSVDEFVFLVLDGHEVHDAQDASESTKDHQRAMALVPEHYYQKDNQPEKSRKQA